MLVVEAGEPLGHDPCFTEWLREQGVTPELTFRVEILDGVLTAYRYAAGEDGKPYVHDAGKRPDEATHPNAGQIAIDEPLRVKLTQFVPDTIAAAARRA